MLTIERDYSLLGHNTFGIDVRTFAFVEYHSEEELSEAAAMLRDGRLPSPWLHIGGGSNLLFTKDWPGTVLHSRITGLEVLHSDADTVTVRVGSGVVWDDFVGECVDRGWYGAENLSGIPGEAGAAAVQNIGAYGVEASDLIAEVDTMDMADGTVRVFQAADCGYGYRRSIFKQLENKRYVVTSVTLRLGLKVRYNLEYKALSTFFKGNMLEVSLSLVREAVLSIRDSKLPDPAVQGSAGSFFTNPVVPVAKLQELQRQWPDIPYYAQVDGTGVKLSAGWLIEQCGWKGRSIGRAGVYPKQALVLVNLGGASGREISALATAVRTSVRDKFGVELHPEVNIF
ncbi:MAG TPA: UDP-N-acetylmuramate dehydrogenase [Candidatus Coprenecus stercoravium]|uniref:UDP-N-acetylenolpyruvoylglucosamine reductase n=1 Tax=Candidatus Coprenecus stercoravium TaxID=2840735 RepID=A0A9D2GMT2_9BACT|nr:UDP-N-acetylmuramate dehydrogenase [Candidatus Coprenecus stercoravium]